MMRVLVVEASHDDRRAIVDALLPLEQIAVQGAVADVRSALRAIAQEAPDVVVTGTELADGSGIELIEAAQKVARPPAPISSVLPASRVKSRPVPGWPMKTCGSFWKMAAMQWNGAFSRA